MTESCCTFTSYTMIDTGTGLAPDPTVLQLVLDTPSSTSLTVNAIEAANYNRERTY